MKSRVLIAGGGVAALEAVLALRELAADRLAVEVFSPRRELVYRPYAVGEPYGAAHVRTYDLERLLEQCGATFHQDSIASVERDLRLAVTHDGERYPYDHLIVCPGAKLLWPVPGAATFWGIAEEGDVGRLMDRLRAGEVHSVAFTTPGVDGWTLPLYELALLAEAGLVDEGIEGVELTVLTPEEAPLQIFGRGASDGVAELLAERGIRIHTGTRPVRFEGGVLETVPGPGLEVDAAVSLPRLEGRRIRGVRHDPDGFVPIDEHCRVIGCPRLYAAGDVTTFPVKQGGIATQQADVIAEAIAAELGAEVEPRPFDPLLRAVLWTGREPRYLQGWLGGGHGETSTLSAEPPWTGREGKIVGRYFAPFIAAIDREPVGR